MNVSQPYVSPILLALGLALAPALHLSAATFDDGLAAKKSKDYPQAESSFSEVIAAEPKNAQAWAERATVRGWQKKYDAAIADWRQAISVDPTLIGDRRSASIRRVPNSTLAWRGF